MRIKWNLIKSLAVGVLFFTIFLGLASVSRAESKEEGMYFSILGVENSIEGDFDGIVTGIFADSDVRCRIPKIESGRGWGILIGGYRKKLAGELYYSCSNHDTSFWFTDLDGDCYYDLGENAVYYRDGECQVIGANIKYFFVDFSQEKLRFFGQFGLFIPKITMEEGAYKKDQPTEIADVSFTGYGADLGLGVLIQLHPSLAITGSAVYRHIRIREVTAFDQDRVPSDSMYGNGRSYNVGLNYYF